MSLIEDIHGGYISPRRARVLSEHIARLIPQGSQLLDIGCGDGLLSHLIMQRRPDIDIRGIEVLSRERNYIPVETFDGHVLPYGDASFDVVLFVDVLHHTEDPMVLLREAVRVVRKAIVIKDHTCNGFLAGPTLCFLDWVGNARHGVALPYNYWSQRRWVETFNALALTIGIWKKDLGLYPRPANWIFERSLHFIARLDLT